MSPIFVTTVERHSQAQEIPEHWIADFPTKFLQSASRQRQNYLCPQDAFLSRDREAGRTGENQLLGPRRKNMHQGTPTVGRNRQLISRTGNHIPGNNQKQLGRKINLTRKLL